MSQNIMEYTTLKVQKSAFTKRNLIRNIYWHSVSVKASFRCENVSFSLLFTWKNAKKMWQKAFDTISEQILRMNKSWRLWRWKRNKKKKMKISHFETDHDNSLKLIFIHKTNISTKIHTIAENFPISFFSSYSFYKHHTFDDEEKIHEIIIWLSNMYSTENPHNNAKAIASSTKKIRKYNKKFLNSLTFIILVHITHKQHIFIWKIEKLHSHYLQKHNILLT